MMDRKKLSDILKASPTAKPELELDDEETEDGGGDDLKVDLAADIVASLKDPEALASALTAFIEHCTAAGSDADEE